MIDNSGADWRQFWKRWKCCRQLRERRGQAGGSWRQRLCRLIRLYRLRADYRLIAKTPCGQDSYWKDSASRLDMLDEKEVDALGG